MTILILYGILPLHEEVRMRQTRVASNALRRIYRSVYKARDADWRASLTGSGAIRLSPPGTKNACFCIATAAYRIRFGKNVGIRKGIGEALSALKLDEYMHVAPGIYWTLGSVLTDASDLRRSVLRSEHNYDTSKVSNIRRILFRILKLPMDRL